MSPLLLGSNSPRRYQLLCELGLRPEQKSSPYDEESFIWSEPISSSIQKLALAKARPLATMLPHRTILTADTLVRVDEQRLGKPRSQDQARHFLRLLRGRWHQVYTAVCVYHAGRFETDLVCTHVRLAELSDFQIEHYIATPLPYDKAGGYAIQGIGGLLVEAIEGCFYNVMGLPVACVARLLKPAGYDLWSAACAL